jgi:hypothetical protein
MFHVQMCFQFIFGIESRAFLLSRPADYDMAIIITFKKLAAEAAKWPAILGLVYPGDGGSAVETHVASLRPVRLFVMLPIRPFIVLDSLVSL